MFASKKYLDLHLEKFWTIAGSGWCLSNRLNIDGSHHFEAHEICPWYSSNEVTTMAPPLKWPDSQHKRMQKKPVPSPLARLSLSQVTALAFAKLSSGRLESFSPVQQRYAKVTQGKNQEPLRIHDSWFMMQISKPKSQVYTSFLILLHVFSLHFLTLPASTRWTRKFSFQSPSSCSF